MTEEDPLEDVPLRVARTRPAMRWGIPFTLIVPVGTICLEIETVLGFKTALCLDPAIIIICFAMVRKDHNAFRLWGAWLLTRAFRFDRWYYGGSAIAPFPIRPSASRPRGIPSSEW